MTLALLTLCLICPLPAQAQGPRGGGPAGPIVDPGHYWKTTYTTSGGTSGMDYINGNQYNTPLPRISTWDPTANGGGIGGQYAVDATTKGTITATMTWIPAVGETLVTDPPSSPVHIIETASASWFATPAFSYSGQDPFAGTDASDGLGDPKVSNPYGGGQTSKGVHLIQKDGLSGTIILDPVQMNANSPICPTPIIWAYASAGATLNVCEDTSHSPRSVTITSSIDPTYRKGSDASGKPAKIENVADFAGTVKADSCIDCDGSNSLGITYTGYHFGSWADGSSYHWYSAEASASAAGIFDPLSDFQVLYGGDYGPGGSGQEHIDLHCTDASDGASATANYFINWHDEWEPTSWPPDGAPYHVSTAPDADVPSWPTYPWKLLEGQQPLYGPMDKGVDITVKKAGFKEVDGGLELGAEPVTAHFGFTYQPTTEISSTKTITPTPALGQGEETWVVYRENVNRTKGHLDHYDTHGYSGPGVWHEDELVAWDTFLYTPYQASGTAMTAPAPGWNPPVY